jgi:hypothetical protein
MRREAIGPAHLGIDLAAALVLLRPPHFRREMDEGRFRHDADQLLIGYSALLSG